MATTGVTLTEVLTRAWQAPFKTKSDYARHAADVIAMAASDGHLTTKLAAGLYGGTWFVTAKGLDYLGRLKGDD